MSALRIQKGCEARRLGSMFSFFFCFQLLFSILLSFRVFSSATRVMVIRVDWHIFLLSKDLFSSAIVESDARMGEHIATNSECWDAGDGMETVLGGWAHARMCYVDFV
ncbi:hypothetical protein V8C42DRAFT_197637 [Trichoderma barbatum]